MNIRNLLIYEYHCQIHGALNGDMETEGHSQYGDKANTRLMMLQRQWHLPTATCLAIAYHRKRMEELSGGKSWNDFMGEERFSLFTHAVDALTPYLGEDPDEEELKASIQLAEVKAKAFWGNDR